MRGGFDLGDVPDVVGMKYAGLLPLVAEPRQVASRGLTFVDEMLNLRVLSRHDTQASFLPRLARGCQQRTVESGETVDATSAHQCPLNYLRRLHTMKSGRIGLLDRLLCDL